MISDIEVKISGAYGEKITANQLYKVLLNFDKMYFKKTDLEKKQFMRSKFCTVRRGGRKCWLTRSDGCSSRQQR